MFSTALLLVATVTPSEVASVSIGDGRWRLTIRAAGTEVEFAEAKLASRAQSLCRGKIPTFGKYRFDATEPLTGAARDGPATLTLTQEIDCKAVSPAPRRAATAVTVTPAVDPASAGLAFAQRYLDAREKGDRATLTATVDAEAMILPQILLGLSAERAKLGPPVGARRFKVTVYDNPPDSPGPGVYIAVDYVLAYRNAPSVCGYLIVREPPGRTMAITREERAVIDAKIAATVPPIELAALRERFRCNIP